MPRVVVSDHAIVRYIERVSEIDLTPIRREIEAVLKPVANACPARFKKDGVTYALSREDGALIVTTVYK